MMQIGVLGASGFVGSRLCEIFHLEEIAKVVPIVRSTNSLARLARFALEFRTADALDSGALAKAFEGCDVVLHSVHGPNELIVEAPNAAYRAAQMAGVRRIVYLSTTSVHGQNPDPGTNEESPLHTRHPFSYNNAKVLAEQQFLRLRERGNVELVVLRPGIVFGPRDRWISNIARSLLDGTAFIVRGDGICNTVYVDNLVHAIRLAMVAPVDREIYTIGDKETVTWTDLYGRVSTALGIQGSVPVIEDPIIVQEHVSVLDRLKEIEALRAVVPHLPRAWKVSVRRTIETMRAIKSVSTDLHARRNANPWQLPGSARQTVPLQTALLHRCQHKFTHERASSRMGYEPIYSVDEGLERTFAWLKFVGYPIVGDHSLS